MSDTTSPSGEDEPIDSIDENRADEQSKSAPVDRETEGPLDESEANPVRPYVDLGGVKIPFAAPRSSGLWHEIRDQIADQIAKQGGTTRLSDGPFGPELLAEIPATTPGQPDSTRLARFIGVDGPRWFLRGVIAGDGAVDQEAASKIEELFRSVVVVRGKAPMPPRDLIPLHMPKTAAPVDDAPFSPGA